MLIVTVATEIFLNIQSIEEFVWDFEETDSLATI